MFPTQRQKLSLPKGMLLLTLQVFSGLLIPGMNSLLPGLLSLRMMPATGVKSVTVVHVGPATSEPTIRKALAIGADDAVRVNAESSDAYFVAAQIAEVIRKEQFDIIMCGIESSDYNGSLVGGMISEFLGIPSVSAVSDIKIEDGQRS